MSHSHILDRVIQLIGLHPTIRLMRLKGGLEFNLPLPQNLEYMNWLVVEVGYDNAHRLCEEYQGIKLRLPNEVNALLQIRNKCIVEEYMQGSSARSLAKRYCIDRKLVETILKKSGCIETAQPCNKDENQGVLWQD